MKTIYALLITLLLLTLAPCCLDAAIGDAESAICDNIDPADVNAEWSRDHCYKDAALRSGKPDLCEKIEQSAPKTKCYMELAEKKNDAGLCDKLENNPGGEDYSRLECLQRIATKYRDLAACDRMGKAEKHGFFGTYNIYECYIKLGKRYPVELMLKDDPSQFKSDDDMLYSIISGKPPAPNYDPEDAYRQRIDGLLISNEYYEVYGGQVNDKKEPKDLKLEDRDIILVSTQSIYGIPNADRYIMYKDGKFWVIDEISDTGFSGPYEFNDFFDEEMHRTYSGSFIGANKNYKVLRRD